MNLIIVNVFVLIVGINLLIGLPFYFKWKNNMEAARVAFEDYLKNMAQIDKQYQSHARILSKNLNTINYWLKTGKDPNETKEESEIVEKEDRFFAGLMDTMEARKWKAAVKKARQDDSEDEDVKSIRVEEFEAIDMDPCDVEQTEMKFYYSTDFGENIFYCVTPQALSKHMYKNVLFFTTARPANMPLVFPYKYEGAQMLSLYKHPSQTVWFLKNWRLIREGLEGASPYDANIDESVTKDFDL